MGLDIQLINKIVEENGIKKLKRGYEHSNIGVIPGVRSIVATRLRVNFIWFLSVSKQEISRT